MPTFLITAHAERDIDDILHYLADVAGQLTATATPGGSLTHLSGLKRRRPATTGSWQ